MGYATSQQVNFILANSLTTGTSPTVNGSPTPLINFGTTPKTNLVPHSLVYQYISWADEKINAALSELYTVPLTEKSDLELELMVDINEYNDSIEVNKASILNPGDVLVFIDGSQEERHIIESVDSNSVITLQDNVIGSYDSSVTRVLRIKYPDPITNICAMFAASNIFEKYFAGSVAPNESEYGKNLRMNAINLLNNVLNGITILHGQRRIGHRFYESNLDDRYALPPLDSDGSRNMGGSER